MAAVHGCHPTGALCASQFAPGELVEPGGFKLHPLPIKTGHTGPLFFGGEGGIRTHGTANRTLDFESSSFDHSDTSPTRFCFKLYLFSFHSALSH